MKLRIVSFTRRGMELSRRVGEALKEERETDLFTKFGGFSEREYKEKPESTDKVCEHRMAVRIIENLSRWTGEQFEEGNAVLFIGACGIAVRTIAPFVKDKLSDSPVLVMDEAGSFVIPILSGHYGGANELAEEIAEKLGGTAVLTTASDVNGLFAVDVFARKNELAICNRKGIAKVASAVLNQETVTAAVAGEYRGKVPEELTLVPYPVTQRVSFLVSPFLADAEYADLQLCPKAYVVGIGCKRGKALKEIEEVVGRQLEQAGIRLEAVAALASIDRKKGEEGLVRYAEKYRLPFMTFSSEVLREITGEFTTSSFVEEQVGVDNVCERSAMAACKEGGSLLLSKYAENGITVAIAKRKWSVAFDEA
ncbi:cobalt-precorrin 5A acetaldehyde-lyase [Anaerocolumna jejuensis DSM 15929]|uniref:Cobalt-precorrin 5A acetaldehyde-lyase n=1 Tax=Anaerocolumna jejuensis DSM 15929 TaxID=1121322 RepID=A0A1M6SLU6_9FIRM|nr:cobalt-precorrin 5A hydrolase [Anaerocolumna jejuensis]SHK45616.1 cobalt-precorrin 5A acetaldehyde-lyase [Anaerocolumna jejuensis DSM 15929]